MQRDPSLTSLRGISALWVVVYHVNILIYGVFDYPLLDSGFVPVGIFFMLSISLLLNSLDRNSDLKHYFIRRIKRIWPMYFATVFMVFLYAGHSYVWLAEQLSFTGYYINSNDIGYVFWSLQIEEFAYLFFPLIHRLPEKWKFRLGIGLFVSALVSSAVIIYQIHLVTLGESYIPMVLSAYGLGILVYLKRVPSLVLPSALMGLLFWSSGVFVALTWIALPGFAYIVQNADRYSILKSRILVKIGDISYGIYLIHFLLIQWLGWLGVVLTIPAAWVFEKANELGLKLVSRKS